MKRERVCVYHERAEYLFLCNCNHFFLLVIGLFYHMVLLSAFLFLKTEKHKANRFLLFDNLLVQNVANFQSCKMYSSW